MLPVIAPISTPTDRLAAYRALAPVPKILIEILALAFTPLDQASLFGTLRGVFQRHRIPLDRNSQNPHLSSLLVAGLAGRAVGNCSPVGVLSAGGCPGLDVRRGES